MTYCVGIMLDKGLVLMSDTRTNSGVDNISTFRKMFYWTVPGERSVTVMTAGNLATTQAVISRIEECISSPRERESSVLGLPPMFQIAAEVGRLLRETVRETQAHNGDQGRGRFTASLILAGQIRGMAPCLFYIYPEGNFIEASWDTPFLQIGETKYGRPILIRAYDRQMSFEDALKLLTVSFDSTLKANLSVGLPLDVLVLGRDEFVPRCWRIDQGDSYFEAISSGWSEALRNALEALPAYPLAEMRDERAA